MMATVRPPGCRQMIWTSLSGSPEAMMRQKTQDVAVPVGPSAELTALDRSARSASPPSAAPAPTTKSLRQPAQRCSRWPRTGLGPFVVRLGYLGCQALDKGVDSHAPLRPFTAPGIDPDGASGHIVVPNYQHVRGFLQLCPPHPGAKRLVRRPRLGPEAGGTQALGHGAGVRLVVVPDRQDLRLDR